MSKRITEHLFGRCGVSIGAATFLLAGGIVLAADASTNSEPLVEDAQKLLLAGDFPAARAAYRAALSARDRNPAQRAMLTLRLADTFRLQRDRVRAATAYQEVAMAAETPAFLRAEARERLAELQSQSQGGESKQHSTNPAHSPSALRLFVAPSGDDSNPGTEQKPFGSLERAREEIRGRRKNGSLPDAGCEVVVRGGTYKVAQTFKLGSQDSGTAAASIWYRAAPKEKPLFTGGIRIRDFQRAPDPATVSRLPEAAKGNVRQIDLRKAGITNTWPLVLGGFASGRGFKSHRLMELYFNGEPLRLARGPNKGTYVIDAVSQPAKDGQGGSKTGQFTWAGQGPERWAGEPELLLYGYWFYGWADSYERVTAIDVAKKEISLEPPYHGYGYRKGQPFYAVNALSELDLPGECHMDSRRGIITFWPPSDPARAVVEVSNLDSPMVELKDVSHLALAGLTWELGCTDGILIQGGTNCLVAGCTVRRMAGGGIKVSGGSGHRILSCEVNTLGRGGIELAGGDRKTLQPGGHVVENCHIHTLSRIDHTYTPAVLCSGVGQRIAHNWFHDIPSSAMRIDGNDHLIEFNEINRVVLESDDQGGVDMFGDPTFLGNVFRYNYFHHIGNWRNPEQGPECGQAGIRLDDAISGVLIYRNIFYRCGAGKSGFGGIQIHGGKDNIIDQNIFADCRWAISFSPWGEAYWKTQTAGLLNSKGIEPALYRSRYPEMDRMSRDLNVNWISRNLMLNCGNAFHRNAAGARALDNALVTRDPGFKDAARGNFAQGKSRALQRLGVERLPFEKIGLYRDEFRKGLPSKQVDSMRCEP